MTVNIGGADRVIRFLVGTALILAPLAGQVGLTLGTPSIVAAMLIGIVLVGTAFFRVCPLYRALGASTCKR